MTKEELQELIIKGDATRLVAALSCLTEAERKKLSTTASGLLKDLERERDRVWRLSWDTQAKDNGPKKSLTELFDRYKSDAVIGERFAAAEIAALGVCPLSAVNKLNARLARKAHRGDLWVQVLTDRRPDWIEAWLDERFSQEFVGIDWATFWALFKAGVCARQTSEPYYRFMASQLNGWAAFACSREEPLSDLLRETPELQEDLWKLFEVETTAFAWDWGESKDAKHESWPTAVLKLAEEGTLDRARLLDSSLSGLTTGFKQNLLSGYANLFQKLKPTAEELATRQATLVDLLNVTTPQVISFALTQIKALEKAKQLDDALFVRSVGPAFHVPTKSPAKTTLSLLKKIGKRAPKLRPTIAKTLVEAALHHPADDIIGAAVKLLGEWPEVVEQSVAESLAAALPDLPATVQTQVRELLAATGSEVAATSEADTAELAERLAELQADAETLVEPWRSLAGVDEALVAMESKSWPRPLEFSMVEVPVLSGVEPIVPIESHEELLEVVAHAIEEVDNPADFERILDAISRLGRDESEEFQRLAAPLLKRVRTAPDKNGGTCLLGYNISPVEFTKLIVLWLAGDPEAAKQDSHQHYDAWWYEGVEKENVKKWLNNHLRSLRERLQQAIQAPLLCPPTHAGGWIAPLVLVERWSGLVNAGIPLLSADTELALLRLAPEGRATALERARQINHPWAPALLWALGDDGQIESFDHSAASLWIAAANARGGRESFEQLVQAGLTSTGPNSSEPGQYSWRTEVRGYTEFKRYYLHFTPTPPVPEKQATALSLSTSLYPTTERLYGESKWLIDVLASLQPANVSSQMAIGCKALVMRLDYTASSIEQNYPYLNVLFAVDRPMDDLACLMLTLGLSGLDQDVRGLAIDAAIETIADGRLHPTLWRHVLTTLSEPGWLKLNRLCDNMAEVARVGPLHAWVVRDSLACLLETYDTLPRDAHYLLAVLLELYAQSGDAPSPEAVEVLKSLKGSSKTAKLAKAILTLDVPATAANDQARLQLLECRIARAQRWQHA